MAVKALTSCDLSCPSFLLVALGWRSQDSPVSLSVVSQDRSADEDNACQSLDGVRIGL